MRTINCSTSLSIRGRPGARRACDPSNLRAMSLRYHARMVSGRAVVATSPRALRPSRCPISPSFARSTSESLRRPLTYSQGREDALIEQVIPLEITKIKHLKQIELEGDDLTVEDIENDYPLNLTRCIEKRLPDYARGYTRGDDWFGERMMNGMNRGSFVPDAARPGHYWIRYFGVCWYDVNDLYALPDVAILFKLKDDGLPIPLEIRLTGQLSRSDHDPFHTRVFSPADGDAWLQTKRVARV